MRKLNLKTIANVREREEIIKPGTVHRAPTGITLIALIITVIVLLILAGVALNFVIGENGILKHAEFARNKYQNSAEQEENELAKIDSYISANRETVTIDKGEYEQLKARITALEAKTNFTSPIFLTSAILSSSGSSTRAAGTYKASSSQYTKSPTGNLSKYLTFTEGTGWTVKKSGFYYLNATQGSEYVSSSAGIYTYILINNTKYKLTQKYLNSSNTKADMTESATLYLKENDVIDFSFEPGAAGIWSGAWFYIYAIFE